MLRPFGINLSMEADVLAAHEEIRGAVEYHHSEGLVESGDRRMLGGVLDLQDMDVSQIMVHRKSIAMLDADLPSRELVRQALAELVPWAGAQMGLPALLFAMSSLNRHLIGVLPHCLPLSS